MTNMYRYQHTAGQVEYYSAGEKQGSPPPPGDQPSLSHNYFVVDPKDSLTFAEGIPDIRSFPVNTPDGDTIGIVMGLLADSANGIVPYAYVKIADDRTVVVPTNQFTMYPDQCLTILEGGKMALYEAPDARYDASDASRADQYWSTFRRRHAA